MTDNRIRWTVTIKFEEGEHKCAAWAETKLRAFNLALIDARMGSPFGSFASPWVSWDAVPTEEIAHEM